MEPPYPIVIPYLLLCTTRMLSQRLRGVSGVAALQTSKQTQAGAQQVNPPVTLKPQLKSFSFFPASAPYAGSRTNFGRAAAERLRNVAVRTRATLQSITKSTFFISDVDASSKKKGPFRIFCCFRWCRYMLENCPKSGFFSTNVFETKPQIIEIKNIVS